MRKTYISEQTNYLTIKCLFFLEGIHLQEQMCHYLMSAYIYIYIFLGGDTLWHTQCYIDAKQISETLSAFTTGLG